MGEESESRTDLTDRSKHTRRRERESEGERAYLRTSCESRYQSRHTGTKRRNTEGMPTRLERERERLWLLPLELMNVTQQHRNMAVVCITHTHTHTHHGIATQRNHRHSGSERVYQIKGMFRVQ